MTTRDSNFSIVRQVASTEEGTHQLCAEDDIATDISAPPTMAGFAKARKRCELIGLVLNGKYRLEAKVGGGGMGEIWAARDLNLGSELMVKLLPWEFSKSQIHMDALLREAKITAQLPAQHFPRVADSGASGDIVRR